MEIGMAVVKIEKSPSIMLETSDEPQQLHGCTQCSYQTPWIFQMNYHVQRNHINVYAAELFHAIVEPEPVPCTHCDYNTYHQFDLFEHCKQAHNSRSGNTAQTSFCEEFDRYHCEHCKYKSDSSLCLTNHHIVSCQKLSRRAKEIGNYLLSNDASQDFVRSDLKKFRCEQCTFKTKHKQCLKRHMLQHARHDEINWFRCDHCLHRSKRKSNLKRHVLLQHATTINEGIVGHKGNLNVVKNEQNKCSYKKNRMLQHARIDWLYCDKCSYKSKRKCDLTTHMSKHAAIAGSNWLRCDHCSYLTDHKSHLKGHMLQHAVTEEIDWLRCEYCSYKAKYSKNLKRHMLQHATKEEITWFRCEQCSYKSKFNASLKRHMLQHAANDDIVWFKCDECPYRAKESGNLKQHMFTHVKRRISMKLE